MIIFLYGPDTYRSRQKLNEIIQHYKEVHKTGLNLRRFGGQGFDFQEIKNEIKTMPMFKEKKLLVLNDIFSNEEFKKEFLENSDKLVDSDDTIVFYTSEEIPASDTLFKFLKKQAKTQEFPLLTGQKLKNWLKKEFLKYQAELEPLVLDKLLEFVNNDLWQLSNEVKKLAAFKKSLPAGRQDKKIQTKDVELLVKAKIDTDIFKTVDAISLRRKKLALDLLHQHLEKGDNPLYLLSMINFQFRNIIMIKDLFERGKPLNLSELHPYVVKKSSQQARNFSLPELKKIYRKIFEVDHNIKTGKLDPQTALDLLITEI